MKKLIKKVCIYGIYRFPVILGPRNHYFARNISEQNLEKYKINCRDYSKALYIYNTSRNLCIFNIFRKHILQ